MLSNSKSVVGLFRAKLWHYCVIAILATGSVHAIIIDGFNSQLHDRFSNSGSFIAAAFDLSGVGMNSSGRWVTMISPNVYLSASHFRPGIGSTVTFYVGNDPSGPTTTRKITSNRLKIGATDLLLGTLDSPLTSDYTHYEYATDDIISDGMGGTSPSQYAQANAYIFGRSPSSLPVTRDMAVGRNRLDRFFFDALAGGDRGDSIVATINANGSPNYVTYEADLRGGDSGGPMFVANGNGLTLVGINWFIGSSGDINYLGATYTGNYDNQIQSFINLNPVPEISSYTTIAFILLLLLFRRHSRLRDSG